MKVSYIINKPKVPDSNYTIVPNLLWTCDLRIEDKVLLGYCMSHKDKHPLNNVYIANGLGVSRKFVADSIKRLKDVGVWVTHEDKSVTLNLNMLKCNPKLQLSVTQSYTNNTNKQEEEKQEDFESVTQSYTSKEKTRRQETVTLGYTSQDLISSDLDEGEIGEEVLNNNFKIEKEILNKNNTSIEEVKINSSINDLQYIIDSSYHFKSIYENGFSDINLNNYSNAFIATNVFEYKTADSKKQDNLIKNNKELVLQLYLVKYSKKVPDSNLWKEYYHQCKESDRLELLEQII